MNKVSKGLFLGSVGIGFGIATVLLILGNVQMRTGSPRAGLLLICLSCIPMLYGAIFMVVLWCKSWAAIQDGHARTTPGKAIGFLFIPLFDFYWVFQAVWGLSKDFNAYLQRNSIPPRDFLKDSFLPIAFFASRRGFPSLGWCSSL